MIRLVTLGVPDCLVAGSSLTDLTAQKTRFALLCYLAVERNASRDEVSAIFWPESDDNRARHALSQSVYELKRVLGHQWVNSEAGRLIVSDAVQTDVADFLRLIGEDAFEQAVNLYHGPFLSGFFLNGSKEFELWVDRQRAQLERAHRRARRECVDQLMADDRLPAAIEAARRWVESDPFEDEANHRLIELLGRAGKRAEALTEYSAYERRLRDELAIEPLDHTRSLIESIRRPPDPAAPFAPADAAGDVNAGTPVVHSNTPKPASVIGELRRRRVFRMAIWYAATSFAVLQFAQTMGDAFALPPWILTLTAILALGGFPVAVVLSWHFDLTEEGIRRAETTRMGPAAAAVLLVLFGVGGALWLSGFKGRTTIFRETESLDTTLIAILPFHYAENVNLRLHEDQLLQDGIARWQGLSVVELFQIRAVLHREGPIADPEDALRIARSLRAGRYVVGEISRYRDSLRIHAALYDARAGGVPIVDRTVRVALSLEGADSTFARLADGLLYRSEVPATRTLGTAGTRSWAARSAFVRGHEALQEWLLPRADSAFAEAARLDPQFTEAHLWRAQIGSWQDGDRARWRFLAEHALQDSTSLNSGGRVRARALVALARDQFDAACGAFREQVRLQPHDFAAWYSLASCLRADKRVFSDGHSPTGKAFRSSYHEAILAYRNAFRIHPSALKAFREDAFAPARRLLFTSPVMWRDGYSAEGDTTRYVAYPERAGDSLAFVPFRLAQALAPPYHRPAAIAAGVRLERETFHDIAAAWRASYPDAAEAAEAVAVALEMLEDRRAIDTLQLSRRLAGTAAERLRLAAYEAMLQLKFSFPDDHSGLRRFARLADSALALADRTPSTDPLTLASVALMRGRLDRAVNLYADPRLEPTNSPRRIQPTAKKLLLHSATAVGADSVIAWQRLLHHLAMSAEGRTRDLIRHTWLLRSIMLSYPRVDPATFRFALATGHPLLAAQAAEMKHDYPHALALLDTLSVRRRGLAPEELTLDALAAEAALLARLGRVGRAAARLDPALNALSRRAPRELCDPAHAASLVRAATLRAELGRTGGDPIASARWAGALLVVMSKPDPVVEPLLERLQVFTRTTVPAQKRVSSTNR